MKKLALTAVFFTLLGHAWGQHNYSFSGASWKALDPASKVGYIHGYLDGYGRGRLEESMIVDYVITPRISKKPSPEEQEELSELQKVLEVGVLPDSVTIGQIGNAVDAFYADFRNAPDCWSHATFSAFQSPRGSAPDDKFLESVRMDDAKNGCK
jgi:hypothetical protein